MTLEIIRNIDPIAKLIGDWISTINIGSITIRLILAVIIGGLIGVERATKNQAAGFRTYILVCVGAAIAMMTNQFMIEYFGSGDVARLGAQVISGIGFLGAGTIIVTSRSQIKGLTTAAGLWSSACIGLAIGIGFYTIAIIGGAIIFIVLSLLCKIEGIFINKSKYFTLHLELDARIYLKDLISLLRANEIAVKAIEKNPAYASSGLSVYTISMEIKKSQTHSDIINLVKNLDYVNYVEQIY